MNFLERLREFLNGLEDRPAPETVADALQQVHQQAYQTIFDRGHGEATRELRSENEELESDLEEAREELSEARERIQSLEEENPDVAELREQFQQELDELEQEYEEKLDDAQQEIRSVKVGNAQQRIARRLVEEHGVDKDYAEFKAQQASDRVQVNEERDIEIVRENSDIPLDLPSDEDPVVLLADEVAESVPGKFVTAEVDTGSGSEGGGGGGGGSGGNRFDEIREQAEEEREKEAETDGPPLEERLGQG